MSEPSKPTTPADFLPAACAIPGCDADLCLTWELTVPLYLSDLQSGATLPGPDGAYAGGWQVVCMEGHVIAVPGDSNCPCGADECEHDDFDGSDDLRTFRAHDAARLRSMLGGASK